MRSARFTVICALALSMALSGYAWAKAPPKETSIRVLIRYHACVADAAKDYEASGESADAIATASLQKCFASYEKFITMLFEELPPASEADQEAAENREKDDARSIAIQTVVEIRAKRAHAAH